MARYLGDKLIAIDNSYHPDIFSVKWSDHIINDIQWLRSDTFSWQSGDVYVTAYNKLVEEYNSVANQPMLLATGEEPLKPGLKPGVSVDETTTESIAETEDDITFVRSTNGFKIALPDQEQAIMNKYNIDGIAWYYILDTENKRFKLPRTKFGFEGFRDNVGDDITESLPNIEGYVSDTCVTYGTVEHGALKVTVDSTQYKVATGTSSALNLNADLSFNAHNSSSTYQDNAPVQERATQMYLYFYVGEYSREAIEQTAGLNSEMFNGKADVNYVNEQLNNKVDLNASNINADGKAFISSLGMPSDRYINLTLGASGTTYTAPANGWVQFGKTSSASGQYISLHNDTSHIAVGGFHSIASGANYHVYVPVKKGDIFKANYSFGGAVLEFRFIYAEGGN